MTAVTAIVIVWGAYRAWVFDWSAEFSYSQSIIPFMRLLAPFMGVVSAVGCALCYLRTHIGLAVFTSIFGVVASFYVTSFIVPVVGAFGIALIVFAKDDFKS